MLNKRLAILVAAMGTLGAVQTGHAALLTYQFGGRILFVDDSSDLLGGTIQPGDPYSGTYVFDPATPDLLPADPQRGWYKPPSSSMSATLDGWVFTAPASACQVSVQNVPGWDELDLYATPFQFAEFFLRGISLGFDDYTGSALASDALPVPPPPLSAWGQRGFAVSGDAIDRGGFKVTGTVDSFVMVPEPGALGLMLLGSAGSWRRRSVHTTLSVEQLLSALGRLNGKVRTV